MKYFPIVLIALFTVFMGAIQAQNLPEHLYEFEESDVRIFCWRNTEIPFIDISHPEEWEDKSAIYLHYYDSYETINLSARGMAISYLGHRRIKLLDKAGIDRFSEIYYSDEAHGGYSTRDREKNFLGVKIIKPTGDETVLKQNEIIEEDGSTKVAIPNLEVGDIIDYYLFTYDYVQKREAPILYYPIVDRFPLEGRYPIRNFGYKFKTDNGCRVNFTTGESGSEIIETREGPDREYSVFQITEKNIESVPSELWHYPYQSSKFIKLFVTTIFSSTPPTYAKRFPSLSKSKIVDAYRPYFTKDGNAKNEYKAVMNHLKDKGNTSPNQKEILEEFYYYIRHKFINQHFVYDTYNGKGPRHITAREFTGHMIYALDELDIPYKLIVAIPRRSGKIDDVIDINETDYLIKGTLHNGEELYFYKPSPFTIFNKLPASIEASAGYSIGYPDQYGGGLRAEKITLSASNFVENEAHYVTEVSFQEDDPTLLKTSTTSTFNGHQMDNHKTSLVNWVDIIWAENAIYGTEKWGDPTKGKKSTRIKLEEFYRTKEEERKKNFEELAGNHFDVEVKEMTHYKTLSSGNKAGETNLKVQFDCTLEGLVRKVGPNYVLKAGQLVGGQISLDEDDMERNKDIYMPYARGYNYTIHVKIPAGYEVVGLENFDLDVDNATGSANGSATLKGDVVTIKFSKYYKHNFEKKEDWPLMKAFLLPSDEFTAKELLLKKK